MKPSKDSWRTIEGWLSEVEAAKLQELATGKSVLEVGTWKGKSAIAMAATADRVITLDHFRGDTFTGYANTGPEAYANIRSFTNIIQIVGDWEDVVEYLPLIQFDLIYYDADHTFEVTDKFLRLCEEVPVVAVHDYDNNPSHSGCRKSVNSFHENPQVFDRLAVCELYV